MRKVGVALLGLLGGLLAAIVLHDVLSHAVGAPDGRPPTAHGITDVLLLPAGGAAGCVLALWLDHRRPDPSEKISQDPDLGV